MRATDFPRAWWPPACAALIAGALFLTPAATLLGDNDGIVAVYSAVSPAYTRTARAGGSFKPETYAFGEGGRWGGSLKDFSIDNLRFMDVAHIIAPTLANKSYLPGKDPQQTDLLIMVYWGTTSGTDETSSSPEYQIGYQMMKTASMMPPSISGSSIGMLAGADAMIATANRLRDRQNVENARILGFLPELVRVDAYRGTPLNAFLRQDVVDDVEESRYFVVLLAYDFQTLWKHKHRKLLWETRFSIRERHNDFSRALAAMAQNASRYFGEDSHGLVRKRLPDTYITFGEPKVLGYEPATRK
jgi:hypothetical protein